MATFGSRNQLSEKLITDRRAKVVHAVCIESCAFASGRVRALTGCMRSCCKSMMSLKTYTLEAVVQNSVVAMRMFMLRSLFCKIFGISENIAGSKTNAFLLHSSGLTSTSICQASAVLAIGCLAIAAGLFFIDYG